MIGVAVAAALLGAGWRRWLGAGDTGRRSVKVAVGLALFFLVAFYTTGVWWQSGIVSAILMLGMVKGHTYDPWEPLIVRYGAVTGAVGVSAMMMTDGLPWLAYAPVGLLAPVGYILARKLNAPCWSCWGEVWLGLLILGPIPLLR